jgi:hypothetical protein
MPKMRVIRAALSEAHELATSGRYTRLGERKFEPILFGFLAARWGRVGREVGARDPLTKRPRIDLRHGSTNPTVVEVACRPQEGGNQLEPSQNASELRKLTRVSQAQAKWRVLALFDFGIHPLSGARLEGKFIEWFSQRTDMGTSRVKVILVGRWGTRAFQL